jgi:TRAP-type mannitol/chloroaromatic compound transport system substrate-binding protein
MQPTSNVPSVATGPTGRVGRRAVVAGAAGLAAAGALPHAAHAQPAFDWRMVTAWPRNAPGPGTSANRIAERLTSLSGGRLRVTVYGAGELVPAFEVFDAVSLGNAQMGHSAAFFWSGRMPAAPFFTAVPFGLSPQSHAAWIHHGGGQALWDALYAPSGIKPFLGGNSGMQMGGWFTRRIEGLDDLRGLRYRIPGLGGAVLRRLGATTVSLPPSEIFTALETGVIDGAEFLGPWSDVSLGLDQAAPYYYWPGFHEPNGSAECLVNLEAFESLPADLQALVAVVCEAEALRGLAEADWRNAETLSRLRRDTTVELLPFPQDVMTAARTAAANVLTEAAEADEMTARILESYLPARARAEDWLDVTLVALRSAG